MALPWGSRSTTRTRRPDSASAAPRFTAVVVLPTPPFWLAMAMIRGSSSGRALDPVGSGVRPDPPAARARRCVGCRPASEPPARRGSDHRFGLRLAARRRIRAPARVPAAPARVAGSAPRLGVRVRLGRRLRLGLGDPAPAAGCRSTVGRPVDAPASGRRRPRSARRSAGRSASRPVQPRRRGSRSLDQLRSSLGVSARIGRRILDRSRASS